MAKRSPNLKRASGHGQWLADLKAIRLAADPLIASWRSWLPKVLLIAGLTLWIYWPSLQGGLIWDDGWYIRINPLLHDLTGLWKFWFQPGSWVEYYPVEETVLWVQYQLWGEHTLGYHLTNVFLQIVNALLVWKLLGKFGLRFAWLGGLIFAVHPVQVESVAYICEMKNTLSMPFFLLSMCAWIDYEESKSWPDYRKALILFTVGMLGKITMAPFAAVILLYAWWKRGRIGWSDLKACVPFGVIAVVLGFMTVWSGIVYEAVGHGQTPTNPLGGILSRIDAAGLNATVYFGRFFLPVDNLLIYPQWPLHPDSLIEYLPWFVLMGVGYVLWMKRRSWGRHVILGLGFFFIILSPFLGFKSVSYMNFTWVMDHFLYIPCLGLIGLVTAGWEDIDTRFPAITRPVALGLVLLMAGVSHSFAALFINEETLWGYILQRNPTVWLARVDLGCDLLEQGRVREAITQFRLSLLLRPDFTDAHFNLAVALVKIGQNQEAEEEYRQTLRMNPEYMKAFLNLGEMKRGDGDLPEAEALFRQGLKVEPDDASLSTDLAGILTQTGRGAEAITIYETALQHNPDVAQLHYDLGVALMQAGSLTEAGEHLEQAVSLDPKIAAAHENLGAILAQQGRLPEAIDELNTALQINPSLLAARSNLALALAQTGRVPEAIDQFTQILQRDPNNAKARDSLAKLQQYESQQNAAGGH